MTIFYGDYYSGDCGVNLTGTVAACIKATQGTHYQNPCYRQTVDEANRVGAYVFAYHFLEPGNGDGQAEWYVKTQNHGNRPVMVDAEKLPDGRFPSVHDLRDFISGVNKRKGRCHLAYIPHWFWQDFWKEPDLTFLRDYPARLVSSEYTTYSDHGPGWNPYGGMWPQIWQYTDTFNMHGMHVDFNAFRGSVTELRAMAETGALPS